MINILILLFLLTLLKFMIEESLLVILMIMELISLFGLFIIISLNPETSLSAVVMVLLTVQVSESVLSLSLFINLMRFSSSEKVSTMKMLKL